MNQGKYKRNEFSFTNTNQSKVLLVSHRYRNGGYNESPIGTYQRAGKWYIHNQDGSPIPAGMEFNIIYANLLGTGMAVRHKHEGGHSLRHVSLINNTSVPYFYLLPMQSFIKEW